MTDREQMYETLKSMTVHELEDFCNAVRIYTDTVKLADRIKRGANNGD